MNGRRIVSLFIACCALSWAFHTIPARGCGCSGWPPGSCCWCASGVWVCQCSFDSQCGGGTGWKCYNRCCVPCNSWYTYTGIGYGDDILVWPPSCPICYQWVGFSSNIEDLDKTIRGTFWGYPTNVAYYLDGLKYQWSTDPDTGTWDPNRDAESASPNWQAPPCIGTVNVRLDVNDIPNDVIDPCPGNTNENRDDAAPGPFTDSVQVVLPTGCSQGVGSVEWTLNETTFSGSGCSGLCGYFHTEQPTGGTHAVYNNCNWECVIAFEQDYEWGVCDSSFTEISDGNDSDVTMFNFCALVANFKYDPNVAGGGCFSFGGTAYSNHACGLQHEQKHRDDYISARDALLDWIEENMDLSLPIVCGDPNSSETCQGADMLVCEPIGYFLRDTMIAIYDELSADSGEKRAREESQLCFRNLADSICARASREVWGYCPYCLP
jgi:hypothetical protein